MKLDAKSGTLVAKLCSEDPDLKCPEHDRMSFLLADPSTWNRLIECVDIPHYRFVGGEKISLEHPITKGEGAYQVIVGFVDALRVYRITVQDPGYDVAFQSSVAIFVEAKPKISNPMEVLRQLNTYRKFSGASRSGDKPVFLLWCPTIDEKTRQVFSSQGIFVSSLSVEELEKSA